MKGYYKIDEKNVTEGKLELWEHEYFGDFTAAKVTLNGIEIGKTLDALSDFYDEYKEENHERT